MMVATDDGNSSELSFLLDKVRLATKRGNSDIPPEDDQSKLPAAAVCMILRAADSKNSLEILLLKRKSFEGDPWSGQIAFPGGRSKSGETLLETVKREVMEETGINLEDLEPLGPLAQVFPGNFSIRVTPFVAIAPTEVEVKVDHIEIDDYFWTPTSYFLDRNNSSVYSFSKDGRKIDALAFVYLGKYVVWGMTLKIIEDFLSSLN
jgi:8-oxo-dGTP pyrophosphatase MutT (NUDIX family)